MRGRVRWVRRGSGAVALMLAAAVVAGCDDGPLEVDDEIGLSGEVLAANELGDVGVLAGATVRVTGPGGEVRSTTSGADGRWSLSDLPAGDYDVAFSADGHASAGLAGVRPPADDVTATVVRRSTVRVLSLESATVDRECGPDPCLDLVLSVSADGLFTEGIRRRVFRGFLGREGEVSSERFATTFTVFVTDDAPSVSIEGDVARVTFDNLRGLDLAGLPAPSGIAVHGATEVSLFAPTLRGEQEAFPDLTPIGVTGALSEPAAARRRVTPDHSSPLVKGLVREGRVQREEEG